MVNRYLSFCIEYSGCPASIDYHQNAKHIKNFIDSDNFIDLPGDSLEQILQYIYDLYYNKKVITKNWIQHAQGEPLGNDLVHEAPSEMATDEGDHIFGLPC